ncbi:hypothetical protein V1522DRAFT_437654 [Lipomyces starkeyi]
MYTDIEQIRTKRKVDFNIFPVNETKATSLEVPASWEEYKRVDEILERDEAKYPQLWYDSVKGVAIVVAPPTPLLQASVQKSPNKSNRYTSHGLTTRAWDGALQYREGSRLTLMIAVEVGVSKSYDSLQAAISWSVCALRCHTYYASIEEAEAAVEQSEDDFQRQLLQHPYGPLERYGVTWFGKVHKVVLETYRREDENCLPETLFEPSQSFTIVENGEYVGHDVSPNLRELVLTDCIPSHLLSGRDIRATPVNFFYQEWFESEFQASMVSTAIVRVRNYGRHIP